MYKVKWDCGWQQQIKQRTPAIWSCQATPAHALPNGPGSWEPPPPEANPNVFFVEAEGVVHVCRPFFSARMWPTPKKEHIVPDKQQWWPNYGFNIELKGWCYRVLQPKPKVNRSLKVKGANVSGSWGPDLLRGLPITAIHSNHRWLMLMSVLKVGSFFMRGTLCIDVPGTSNTWLVDPASPDVWGYVPRLPSTAPPQHAGKAQS